MTESEQATQERKGDEQEAGEQPRARAHEVDQAEKAQKAEQAHDAAQERMKELEEMDEPPTDLDEWPDDEAKYVTFGGGEGDHSYAEGPEAKLGPSDLERRSDGSVVIEGEEVDNPDDYKAAPVPGGPTDPDSPELAGERKKREKMERMYGEGAVPDAASEDRGQGSPDDQDEQRS